jgi:hypothetical protein
MPGFASCSTWPEIAASSDETLARLKTRMADSRAIADKDPRLVYNRLVGWLSGRNRYEILARWPAQIDAVSHAQVLTMLQGMSAPGRIVTGTLNPPKDAQP